MQTYFLWVAFLLFLVQKLEYNTKELEFSRTMLWYYLIACNCTKGHNSVSSPVTWWKHWCLQIQGGPVFLASFSLPENSETDASPRARFTLAMFFPSVEPSYFLAGVSEFPLVLLLPSSHIAQWVASWHLKPKTDTRIRPEPVGLLPLVSLTLTYYLRTNYIACRHHLNKRRLLERAMAYFRHLGFYGKHTP